MDGRSLWLVTFRAGGGDGEEEEELRSFQPNRLAEDVTRRYFLSSE